MLATQHGNSKNIEIGPQLKCKWNMYVIIFIMNTFLKPLYTGPIGILKTHKSSQTYTF